jgi:hypothetical protein
MGICSFRQRIEGGGCLFFSDGYCTNSQSSFYRCIDYIASVSGENIDISYSQIRDASRCMRLWGYKQILGLQTKEQYQSISMRMGSEIQRLLSKSSDVPTYFSPQEKFNKDLIQLYLEIIAERELIPSNVKWEVELKRNGFHGIMDLVVDDKTFGEIKFTGSPDFYLNNAIAWDQLEGYCYLDPSKLWAVMMPIRHTALKDKADEEPEVKLKRIRLDINKKFNFYFPYYKAERNGIKWGQLHPKNQFDMQEFERMFKWVKKEIKEACKCNYFVRRRANCLSPGLCDFFSTCENGGNINWELFEKRRPKGAEDELEKRMNVSTTVESLTT